jgi:hypothetical protein
MSPKVDIICARLLIISQEPDAKRSFVVVSNSGTNNMVKKIHIFGGVGMKVTRVWED